MNTLGVQTLHKIISTFTQEKCIHRLSIARQNLRITHPLGKCYTQISLDLHKNNLLPTTQISLQIKSLQIYTIHIDPYANFDYKLLFETKQSMSFIKDIKDVGSFLPSLICKTHFCKYKQKVTSMLNISKLPGDHGTALINLFLQHFYLYFLKK